MLCSVCKIPIFGVTTIETRYNLDLWRFKNLRSCKDCFEKVWVKIIGLNHVDWNEFLSLDHAESVLTKKILFKIGIFSLAPREGDNGIIKIDGIIVNPRYQGYMLYIHDKMRRNSYAEACRNI